MFQHLEKTNKNHYSTAIEQLHAKAFDVDEALNQAKQEFHPMLPVSEVAIVKEVLKKSGEYCILKSSENTFSVYCLKIKANEKSIKKYQVSVSAEGLFTLSKQRTWFNWTSTASSRIPHLEAAIVQCLAELKGVVAEYQAVSLDLIRTSTYKVAKKSHHQAVQQQQDKYREEIKSHLLKIQHSVWVTHLSNGKEVHLTAAETQLGLDIYQELRKKYQASFLLMPGNTTEKKVNGVLYDLECYLAKKINPAEQPAFTLENKKTRMGQEVYQIALRALLEPGKGSFPNLFHRGSTAYYPINNVKYSWREILAYYWLAASDPDQSFPQATQGTSTAHYLQESILNFISILAEIRAVYGPDSPSCAGGTFARLSKNGLMYRRSGTHEAMLNEIATIVPRIHSFLLKKLKPSRTMPMIAEVLSRKAYLLESNEDIFEEESGAHLKAANEQFIQAMKYNQLPALLELIYAHSPHLKRYHGQTARQQHLLKDNFAIAVLSIYEIELERMNFSSVYFEPHEHFLSQLATMGLDIELDKFNQGLIHKVFLIRNQLMDLSSKIQASADPQSQEHQDETAELAEQLSKCNLCYFEREDFIRDIKLQWGIKDYEVDHNRGKEEFYKAYDQVMPLLIAIHRTFKTKNTTGIRYFAHQFYKDIETFCQKVGLAPNILFSIIVAVEDGSKKNIVQSPNGSYFHSSPAFKTAISSPQFFKPASGKEAIFTLPRMLAWIDQLLGKKRRGLGFTGLHADYHCFCYDYIDRYQTKFPSEAFSHPIEFDLNIIERMTGYNLCGEEALDFTPEDLTPLKDFTDFLLLKVVLEASSALHKQFIRSGAAILHVFFKLDSLRLPEKRILLPYLPIEDSVLSLIKQKQYELAHKLFDGAVGALDPVCKERILSSINDEVGRKQFAEWLCEESVENELTPRLSCP